MCRASQGVCDVEERCTGAGPSCPADAFASNALICRAAAGSCDVAENCTGTSGACPPDAFKASGSACTDDGNLCTSDVCNSTGTCTHPARVNGSSCGSNGELCTNGVCGCGSSGSETQCGDGADND
ncbi:MAG: hypothetical protein ACK4N5_26655, partial [Myxococcales bacterium]